MNLSAPFFACSLALGQGLAGPLSPAESLEQFTVFDDLEIDQLLAEPLVKQPLFVNFDERGRLWLVQYQQYPHPAGLKMTSRDDYWRVIYDTVPVAPPNHVRGATRLPSTRTLTATGCSTNTRRFSTG